MLTATGGRASDNDGAVPHQQLGGDDALLVHGVHPAVRRGLLLLLHDQDGAGIQADKVVVNLEDLVDRAMGRQEHVLVGPPLHPRQPVQCLGLAAPLLFHLDQNVGALGDLKDDHVHYPDDLPIGLPGERCFALGQLVGELLQGLVAILPKLGDVELLAILPNGLGLEEVLEVLLPDADRCVHQGGDVVARDRLHLHLARPTLLLVEPVVRPGVALRVLVLPLSAAGHADRLEDLGVTGGDTARKDLLAVDRAHAWVRGGVLLLLEVLAGREFELKMAVL
mmetsp:Transcript_34688/g.78771  ORF Transcript_34688/g.78771 Transcript_34688/m.78771 type:complete len:280 (-) Transcript_34688:1636-2475(-)